MINDCVEASIKKYGQSVTIINSDTGNQVGTRAFIQPLRYKDETYMGGKFKNIGQIKGAKYLYIGNKDVRLDKFPLNTIIKSHEDQFVLKRAEKVYFNDKLFYIWAILQPLIREA